jgi:hypothetical protein
LLSFFASTDQAMYFLPAERLRLYRDFKSLEVSDFNGLIRFYEQNEDGIRSLDFDEYLDCTVAYTFALYEATHYGKFAVMCDHLIEQVIMHNVDNWGGEDLYKRLLLKKATALYYQQEYAPAERILREIVKIYPFDPLAALYLNKTLLRQKPNWLFHARAASVLLALLAAAAIALEIFAFPRFFPQYTDVLQLSRNLLVATSLASLSLAESGHALRCWFSVKKFVLHARRRKKDLDANS